MILKPDKETTHTHRKANITDKHRLKNPPQNVSKLNNPLKGSYTKIKWDLAQGCKDGSIFKTQSM